MLGDRHGDEDLVIDDQGSTDRERIRHGATRLRQLRAQA